MGSDFFEPVTLSGAHVRLLPLSRAHTEGLRAAVQDGELWRLWYTSVPAPEEMEAEVGRRLALGSARSMLPFTVVETAGDQIVGMTTLINVDAANRRVEIGSTWYAQRVQRTSLNTEAKLLLLRYAFVQLGCIAVEFRTHFMNHGSRRAIERLGAKLDGVLRSHSLASDRTLRDTCVYSVIAAEWPTVESHLQWQIRRHNESKSPDAVER